MAAGDDPGAMKTLTYPHSAKRLAPVRAVLSIGLLLLTLTSARPVRAGDTDDPLVRAALEDGTLTEAQKKLAQAVEGKPATGDAEANHRRYALGIVQFLRAGEKLGQSWHHYGLVGSRLTASLPFFRLPVDPANPATVAPISYEDFRAVFVTFLADIQAAEATLAALPDDPGKVAFRPGHVHIDYANTGKPGGPETVWTTLQHINPGEDLTDKDADTFLIHFDAGDVPWFRGYCHVLSALTEIMLGYDESNLFDRTGHLFFEKPRTPFPFLLHGPKGTAMDYDRVSISDLIAFIHLLNFPVREPARLTAALDHLARVPALGRESWRRIQAETDDDHEWIPNPHQTGVLPAEVTQERIDAWMKVLDECEAILAGKKLAPFWRTGVGRRGVNVRRAFTRTDEPRSDALVAGNRRRALPRRGHDDRPGGVGSLRPRLQRRGAGFLAVF